MRRYFEFAVLVVIVGVLAVFLFQALGRAQLDMEEAGVQMEATAIRAQLMEVAVHRETFGGTLPVSNNPMDWVSNRPANYRGAMSAPPQEQAVWYFDTVAGELIYRFRDGRDARFRLSRERGRADGRGIPAGIGLLRLTNGIQ